MAFVPGPPAGTSTVLPAMAIGELVVVGNACWYTIAPVVRLSAISFPVTSVVKTRLLATVVSPSGRVSTLVSHSTAPVVRLSASMAPVAVSPASGAFPLTEPRVVDLIGTLRVAT